MEGGSKALTEGAIRAHRPAVAGADHARQLRPLRLRRRWPPTRLRLPSATCCWKPPFTAPAATPTSRRPPPPANTTAGAVAPHYASTRRSNRIRRRTTTSCAISPTTWKDRCGMAEYKQEWLASGGVFDKPLLRHSDCLLKKFRFLSFRLEGFLTMGSKRRLPSGSGGVYA